MRNQRRRVMALSAACVALVMGGSGAFADRGAIVPIGEVNIEEPAQRAIIAHNGKREILILQTDVKADRETVVVEFMPLPSKPEVSLAPEGCFKALQEIIKKHDIQYLVQYRGKDARGEGVTVVVAAQLGPHDVTVVEVKDVAEFTQWVSAFFKEKGLGEPALGDKLPEIVAGYLERGLRFFAFDVVTLSPEKQTVQPLTYEFDCEHLYYPLVVSNLYGGKGTIEMLTVLHPGLGVGKDGGDFRGLRIAQGHGEKVYWSTAAFLAPAEMARLHPGIPELLGDAEGLLQAQKYEGPLDFDRDVWEPLARATTAYGACWKFFEALEAGDARQLEAIVSVPFAFDRKAVIEDMAELMERFRPVLEKRRGKRLPIGAVSYQSGFFARGVLDDFNREFLSERPGAAHISMWVTVEDEKVLFMLKHVPKTGWLVAGFSD